MHIPDDAAVITSPSTNAAIGVESLYDEDQRLKQHSWGELRQTIAAWQDSNLNWMDHVNEVIVGYSQNRLNGLDKGYRFGLPRARFFALCYHGWCATRAARKSSKWN